MRRISNCLVILFATLPGFAAHAQTYLGADAALRRVEELVAKPKPTNEISDVQSKLRADLKAFQLVVTNLPPDQAATGWLALVDRAVKCPSQAGENSNASIKPIEADDVLDALPPPAAWGELAKAIAARKAAKGRAEIVETGLRFLAATLTGDAEGRKRETALLQARARDGNAQSSDFYRNLLQQLNQSMLAVSDDPEFILKSLERQLDALRGRPTSGLAVPNLVSEVGPEKAGAFLRKALTQSDVRLTFEAPNETSRLAQKLALELMDQLKTPQWGLINSLDAVELYEAMDKRFGTKTNNPAPAPDPADADAEPVDVMDPIRQNVPAYYLLGLVAKGRTKDAVAFAKKAGGLTHCNVSGPALQAMEHAGYTAELDDFFHELLSQNPALPFWDQYVPIAAKAGGTERMLKLARATAARDDVSDNKKAALHQILCKALLAADAVDEGVQEIRRSIALETATPDSSSDDSNKGELGVMLAQIGLLLQKPEWTEEGIGVAKAWLAQSANQNEFWSRSDGVVDSLDEILLKLKRGPEAESILTDALAHAVRDSQNPGQYPGPSASRAQQVLTAMADLYHRAGRESDVLALLEKSPDWGVDDLSLVQPACGAVVPIKYFAANALVATGQTGPAGRIIDDMLNSEPGLDRGYELLLALQGTNAIPRLDELFAQDPFEERPLIWKAHLLRQENQLAAAETTIRQAIAVDPSDGEEGRGDRMRAYAELADILEARGNKKDADFYREIVKAIRLSEDADQFYAAGLLKRAIAMYEEGLNHFADAYCIQSRLAVQLSEQGKNQEAEEHYRRAYELMPDSFGRVESHCFGCEHVFDGERAQGIAEKVFIKLAAERPDKPQVHYLLGYLREEEERYNEARTNYLTAVRLDPAYLNAWEKLEGISEHILMPPKERDEIVFNILRLDPLQRHGQPSFECVSDLAGLWNAVAAAARRQPAPVTNLFALTASKAALENKKSAPDRTGTHAWEEAMRESNANLSPGRALAQTPFVRTAGQLIINDDNGVTDE